jgi:hypothetical protein
MVIRACVWGLTIALASAGDVLAQKSALAREAAEYVAEKFGREAASEGVEVLARKGEALALEHGDEALLAFKKVGPRTFGLVEQAGEQGGEAVRLLSRYGDEAVWVVSQPKRLALCAAHGDEAALALMKHGEIAEPLIEKFGSSAASAVNGLSRQNARRLAMMAEDGALEGRQALLDVVGRYGDRAMDFVWRNKGALATASVLAAFLANPEPFLDGVVDISGQVAENALRPLSEVPAEVARGTNWTVVILTCLALLSIGIASRWHWRKKRSSACTNRDRASD